MTFRQMSIVAFALVCAWGARDAGAYTQTFIPSDPDMGDLEHQYAVRWGIQFSVPAGYTITGASIQFTNIYNWDNQANYLYIDLLNISPGYTLGLKYYYDNPGDVATNGDYFNGQFSNLLLTTYSMGTTPTSLLTYNFTASELSVLASYISDGYFALGFDPDCHYFNDGVKFLLELTPTPPSGGGNPAIPEPITAALSLMSIGALGMAVRRRRIA